MGKEKKNLFCLICESCYVLTGIGIVDLMGHLGGEMRSRLYSLGICYELIVVEVRFILQYTYSTYMYRYKWAIWENEGI